MRFQRSDVAFIVLHIFHELQEFLMLHLADLDFVFRGFFDLGEPGGGLDFEVFIQ